MAITATGTPINRSNIQLPNEVSAEILQKTQEASIVMQLARQIPLPETACRFRSSLLTRRRHG